MIFEHFPYTNFHDLNLDWILRQLKLIEKELDEFVAINIIKYADPIQWDITKQYAKNTVVVDPATGSAYISTQPVPNGVPLSNTDYWSVIFDYDSVTNDIKSSIALDNGDSGTVPVAIAENDLLWWHNEIFRATVDMAAGTALLIGTNIEPYTVDRKINDVITALLQETQDRIDGDTTLQDNLDAEIQNRTDADTALQDDIDSEIQNRIDADTQMRTDLEQLIADTGLQYSVMTYGAAADGVTNDVGAFRDARNAAQANNGVMYVPPGTYYLENHLLISSKVNLVDCGTYPAGKPIQSRKLKESTFKCENVFTDVPTVFGTNASAAIQSICYDSLRDRFVIGFSDDTNNTPQIVAVKSDFSQVLAGPVTGAYGHINDLAYDSKRDVIYCATGNVGPNANKILILNAASLAITGNIARTAPVYQVSYDADTDLLMWIQGGTIIFARADDYHEILGNPYQSPSALGIPGTWTGQGSFVYKNQFFMVLSSTYKFLLVQYDYPSMNLLNYYIRNWDMDEIEDITIVNDTAYIISGQTALTITTFNLLDSDSYDRGYLADGGELIPVNADMHDYMRRPGRYWIASGANAATLANMPDGYNEGGFTLLVMRTAFYRCRCFLIPNDVRTIYTANVSLPNTYGKWYRLLFEPDNDAELELTNFTTAGYFATNGNTISFFVPTTYVPTRNATWLTGAVTVRVGNTNVASNFDITDTTKVSGKGLNAMPNGYRANVTLVGMNTTLTKDAPCGVSATIKYKK